MSTNLVAERTQTDAPLELVVNQNGGVTGLTATVRIRDGETSNSFLDFADNTFKTSGHTTIDQALTEIGGGVYALVGGLDLSAITNLPAGTRTLVARYTVSGSVSGVSIDTIQLVETFLDIPGMVWDILSASHTVSGSFGELMLILQGLLGGFYFLDSTTYDSNGFLSSGRIRVFLNAAATNAATDGGSGEGEIATITYTGVVDGTHNTLPDTLRGIRT